MRSDIQFKLDTTELDNDIASLVNLTSKNMATIYRRSMSSAAIKTVVKEARRDLKSYLSTSDDSTGETAKALGVKNARRTPTTLLGARVSNKYSGQLIHILEQGTQQRTTNKDYNRGSVMGLEFYQKAFRSKQSNLISEFDDKLKDNYNKYVEKKLNKR